MTTKTKMVELLGTKQAEIDRKIDKLMRPSEDGTPDRGDASALYYLARTRASLLGKKKRRTLSRHALKRYMEKADKDKKDEATRIELVKVSRTGSLLTPLLGGFAGANRSVVLPEFGRNEVVVIDASKTPPHSAKVSEEAKKIRKSLRLVNLRDVMRFW